MHKQVICVDVLSTSMSIVSLVFFFPHVSADNKFNHLVLPSCYANCDSNVLFWNSGCKAIRKKT